MTVFLYTPTLRTGGSEKQCALTAATLQKNGYDCTILINYTDDIRSEYQRYIDESGVEVLACPKGLFPRMVFLFRLFRKKRNSVLFNYLTYPDVIGGFIGWLAGLRKVVGGIETDRMYGYKFWAEYIAHHFFSTLTICNSQRAFDFLVSRGFSREKMIMVPNGIATARRLSERINETPIIITVGRFVPEKDYGTFIEVIDFLYRKKLQFEVYIVGYGALESFVKERIASKKLEGVIHILPGASTNIEEWLQKSNIYVSTSIQEGTSNSILEAMNAGLPVVATNVGDTPYMVENGATGFVVEPRDVDGLASCIEALLNDKQLRAKLGKASLHKIKTSYSLQALFARYEKIIEGR